MQYKCSYFDCLYYETNFYQTRFLICSFLKNIQMYKVPSPTYNRLFYYV